MPTPRQLNAAERPVPLVGWTIVFATLAGWLEIILRLAKHVATGDIMFANADALWITPLSTLALMLPGGIVVAFLHRMAPHRLPARVARGLIAMPAVFSLVWMAHPSIQRWAIVALSLGVTMQITPWLARRALHTDRLAWGLAGISLSFLLLAAAGVTGWYALRERQTPAAGAWPDRPNVLLLVLDTVRARSLSLYGNRRLTSPEIERLAARGVVFDRAYATSPWTLPSHATLFTGRYPYELSADWTRPLDGHYPTLAEVFARDGYQTAGFVANLLYAGRGTGLERGFGHYTDWPRSAGRILEGSSLGFFLLNNPRIRDWLDFHDNWTRKLARDVNREFLAWLDHRTMERPFFVFLNYYDAHEPYLPPAHFAQRFGQLPPPSERDIGHDRRADGKRRRKHADRPDEVAVELLAYESAIASLDAEIGRLLGELDRRGLTGRTIVVLTSDHGELHGEHGIFEHGNSLYQESLHVPLIVAFPPRLAEGTRVASPVSLRDVAATVADLAGVNAGAAFPGSSLARWAGQESPSEPVRSRPLAEVWPAPNQDATVPVARGYMRSLAGDKAHYIRNGDGIEELYSLEPAGGPDLAGMSAWGGELAQLRGGVDTFPAASRAGFATPRARPARRRP